MPKIPFQVDAEYRGAQPAGEATIEGEKISYASGLRFEIELPDGDVDTITLRQSKVDELATFDSAQLKRGDRVVIVGMVNVSRDGGYVRPYSIALAEGVKLRAAA